jgi:HK97 family phage major capsid protein
MKMSIELNARKKELLDAQEKMLNAASEAKVALTPAQEEQFASHTKEIEAINVSLARFEAIAKGKREIGVPKQEVLISGVNAKVKTYSNCTPEYADAFWKSMSTSFRNTNSLAEVSTGAAADGSYLVPSQTDPSIPNLAIIEASARKLSRVITTEMDLKLPYQAAKSTAAAKAESYTVSGTAFSQSVPTFNTTTLTAYMGGNSIYVSWELLQDVKALSAFITAELNRAVFTYEENAFINGNGTTAPLGYVNGATAQATASLTSNTILDLIAALNKQYYAGASFLFNRSEFHRLYKAQIAASMFQTWVTYDANGQARLLGFPVAFSSQLATYTASPAVDGYVLFGDFASGWVIGDRGDSNIRVKVLDQVAAVNGQTILLGYRRTDQRCILAESVQLLTTSG